MSDRFESANRWVYEGVWGILSRWLRVPREAPALPARAGEPIHTFHPAEGYLRYLKLQFWIGLLVIDVLIMFGWVIVTVAVPLLGFVLLPVALALAIVPDIVAYVAIHVRYDATWYVMSNRSLRMRTGVWVQHEMTFTFENVQNVSVRQGPLQRYYGIADVIVETAGGGSSAQTQHAGQTQSMHRGVIEGVAQAHEIREAILLRLKHSQTAGLGDELHSSPDKSATAWSRAHVEALRDIRDALREWAG